MPPLPDDLNGALALNICRTRDGWQASLERSRGAFSIGHGPTPTAAIEAVFAPIPASFLPPPPYQVPQ